MLCHESVQSVTNPVSTTIILAGGQPSAHKQFQATYLRHTLQVPMIFSFRRLVKPGYCHLGEFILILGPNLGKVAIAAACWTLVPVCGVRSRYGDPQPDFKLQHPNTPDAPTTAACPRLPNTVQKRKYVNSQ